MFKQMNQIIDKFMPYILILLGLFLVYTGEVIPGGIGVVMGVFMFGIDLKKYGPFIIICLGLFMLGFMGQIYPAAACIILGALFLLERFWPDRKIND